MTTSLESKLPKRTLIIGAAGFLGYAVGKKLAESGLITLGIDRRKEDDSKTRTRCFNELLLTPGFFLLRGDPGDFAFVSETIRNRSPECVLYLDGPSENRRVAVSSGLAVFSNVLEACAANPKVKKLFFRTSDAVYGDHGSTPVREEDADDGPAESIGAIERATEVLAQSVARDPGSRLSVTSLRIFNPYGPGESDESLIGSLCAAQESGRPVKIPGAGDTILDCTYVDDVVDAVLLAMRIGRPEGSPRFDALNIGSGRGTTVLEILSEIESASGRTAVKTFVPQPFAASRVADISRIRRLTGFSPKVPLDEGIRKTFEWHQTHRA